MSRMDEYYLDELIIFFLQTTNHPVRTKVISDGTKIRHPKVAQRMTTLVQQKFVVSDGNIPPEYELSDLGRRWRGRDGRKNPFRNAMNQSFRGGKEV